MPREPLGSGLPLTASPRLAAGGIAILLALVPLTADADETGVSFWLPGQFGSLAAVPQTPGWSFGAIYYHTSVGASGDVAAAKEIQIGRIPATVNVSLNANLNVQGLEHVVDLLDFSGRA
jgi:hypothetical protein